MGTSKKRPGIECGCLKPNGYCIYRDDMCSPGSLKCKKNPKTHINPVYAGESNSSSYSKNKTGKDGYDPFTDELYSIQGITKTLDMRNSMPEIYIFKGFLRFDRSIIIDCKLIVTDIKTGIPVHILVAYNPVLNKYYMSERQLRYYQNLKKFLNIKLHPTNLGSENNNYSDFKQYSELSLYGYSVGRTGLPEDERHELLKYIIDNDIMFGMEIIKHLQGCIALRKERMDKDFSSSIEDWENDIIFISQYASYYIF